jgi:hypothetical protein
MNTKALSVIEAYFREKGDDIISITFGDKITESSCHQAAFVLSRGGNITTFIYMPQVKEWAYAGEMEAV